MFFDYGLPRSATRCTAMVNTASHSLDGIRACLITTEISVGLLAKPAMHLPNSRSRDLNVQLK
jgi:hypothetical protein